MSVLHCAEALELAEQTEVAVRTFNAFLMSGNCQCAARA